MNKSFYQIATELETFATNHIGIQNFFLKPLSDFTANNYVYPLMWVELSSINFKQGEARINLSVYFVDRLKPDYDNFIKVISDTLKLCEDFYSYFTEYEEDFGFYFNNDALITPIEYAFDDNVAGNKTDIVVQVSLNRDKNNIPIND